MLKYQETESDLDQDMRKFNSEITKTLRTFRSAISTLDAKKVNACLEVYADSLDGNDEEGKFVRHWKDMMKAKVCNLSLKKIVSRTHWYTTQFLATNLGALQSLNLSLYPPLKCG